MRSYILFTIMILICLSGNSQTINFGSSTSMNIGSSASFFAGGNTTFNGTLNNQGTIVSYSNLDFVSNTDVGSVKFTGTGNQELRGDTLNVSDFVIDKQGTLILLTDRVVVSGSLMTDNGVIDAEDEDDLLVSGSSQGAGDGFVEGKLVGISQGQPVTFPMGVNGSTNYVTLSNLPTGAIVSVECRVADPSTLLPDENMVGIGDEVEWILSAAGDSINANVQVDFSGVDLETFSNGEPIRSNAYVPAIAVFSEEDTLYHVLNGQVASFNDDLPNSEGVINGDESVWITNEGIRMGIALIPIIESPTFFVPNAFAPNGTIEDNRIFRPYFAGASISSILFTVYDSFNKEVYSINESGNDLELWPIGWNGILNSGQEAPDGVYYYNVRIIAESQEYTRTGSVLLVK